MIRIRQLRRGTMLVLGLALILGFQNCGKPLQSSSVGGSSEWGSNSHRLSDSCLDSESDTCLFLKNPVSQSMNKVSALTTAELEGLQKLAAPLGAWTTESLLKNDSFIVLQSGSTTPLGPLSSGNWRYRLSEPNGPSKVGQVMSFYWANYAAQNALRSAGRFYASDKSIKIITEDALSGWAPGKNQIHLKTSGGSSMALDASVLVYYLGWANLDYATKGAIHVESQDRHRVCGSEGKPDCCKVSTGCSRALASGQADYLVAMTFPESPALGDGWTDAVKGQSICQSATAARDPRLMAGLSAAAAFSLCQSQNQEGSVYAMGAMYASLWWSVRKSASSPREVDQLFMKHLEKLRGDDDFVSVQKIILDLDRADYGGKYRSAFEKEFQDRGL